MKTVSTARPTGLTLYAFPDGASLADWTTRRVLLAESSAPNTGRYTASLDETITTLWRLFSGASQPSAWSQSIEYFDLSGPSISLGQYAIAFDVENVSSVAIQFALITIKQSGQIVAFQLSNSLGVANFNLSSGTYTYSVSASGFESIVDQSFTVSANATILVDMTAETPAPASTPSACRVTIRTTRNVANQATRALITSTNSGRENERAFLATAFDGSTNESGLLVIDLPWSSLPGIGNYRFRFMDPTSGAVLHDRSVTVPDLSSANYEDLVDVS
jgi:hypothetical protein